MNLPLILNDDIVKIYGAPNAGYTVYIKLSGQDGWIEHNQFPGNLQGKIAAVSLATDCMAGKFFPAKVVSEPGEGSAKLAHKPKQIGRSN